VPMGHLIHHPACISFFSRGRGPGGSHIGGGLLVSSSTLLECRVGSLCHCAKKCCTHQPKKCRLPRTTCCSKHPPNSSVLPAFILPKTVTSKANSRSRKFSISNPKLLPFETFLRFPVQTSNVLKIVAHLKTVHPFGTHSNNVAARHSSPFP
jgi:hypothetical protein